MFESKYRLAAVVFPEFETLDLFGPLQIFGTAPELFEITTVAPLAGSVRSAQGQTLVADHALHDCPTFDALLVPGGSGTRTLVDDGVFLDRLATRGRACGLVMSVCTGAALLARAGLLDGRRATTNKLAFEWVKAQGPNVRWVAQARWIDEDGVATAAGVSAGIDMALAVVARVAGYARARELAQLAEYEWHEDPDRDPFASLAGLV